MLKKIIISFVLCVLVVSSLNAQEEKEFPVEQILDEIQFALTEIQTTLKKDKLPPLKSVDLTLETYYKRTKGGKIKILIFSFGKKWEKETSQQLHLTLVPPKAKDGGKVSSTKSLSQSIIDLVIIAAEGVQKAKNNPTAPLNVSNLEIQIKFTIIKDTSIGLEYEIALVSSAISGNVDLKRTGIHTMKITFAIPEKKD